MEDIIGFLILMATLIISVVASVKKQGKKNKTSEASFENTSAEYAGVERETEESYRNQSNNKTKDSWDEVTDYEESTGEEEEAQPEEPDEEEKPSEAEQKERGESTVKPGHTESSSPRETYRTKKRKPEKKSKIQEIKEKFDVEEGIIYSEILHRKYF